MATGSELRRGRRGDRWWASGRLCGLILPVVAATLPLVAGPAQAADTYPDHLVKAIVPFPAGGPTDVAARLVVDQLGRRLGQAVVLENQPGAGGRTGSKSVAKAAPDGYTLLVGGTNLNAVVPAIYKKLDYDPVKDFVAVAAIASDPLVMVGSPNLQASTVSEVVAYGKANPGKLSAGAVTGISAHFATELFRKRTGLGDALLVVPYKGGAPAIQDLLGDHVQIVFNNKSVLLQLILDARVKAIAVGGAERWRELPKVPSLAEVGYPGFPSGGWYGLLAPAGTPPDVIAKLNRAVNEILASDETKASLARIGTDPQAGSPEEFARVLSEQVREWEGLVQEAGLHIE